MKILLTGFFGEGNLGDESILRAIFSNIPSNNQVTLTCGKQPSISGPKMILRRGLKSWPQFLQSANACDKTIFSGGILQDWSFEGITFFALRILAASIFNAEPTLWGAGIGPIRKLAARKLASKALKRVKIAWLRDKESLSLFNQLGEKPGQLGADWSWNFELMKSSMAFSHAPLGLNLRNWPFTKWEGSVATQMKHVGRQIIGIPARASDTGVIKEFAPKATILAPASFSEVSELCQNISYGIAMRYHVALALIRSGVPTKLVAYDHKVRDLAEEAGIELLSKNSISGFKLARPEFEPVCKQRFSLMQNAFNEFVSKK